MNIMTSTIVDVVENLVVDFLKAIDGIPDEDLATWKPAASREGGGEMNTFAAMAVHTASGGRWMFVHQVCGEDVDRDREAEFHAIATRAEIEEHFQGFLNAIRDRADMLESIDLDQMPPTFREQHATWTRAHYLLHMVDHTGIHVGHAQVQRQLWNAEKRGSG